MALHSVSPPRGPETGSSGRVRLDGARPLRPIPPKLYRIGEITEHYGFSRQTIHNYTTMGLITETRRTPGGHRLYAESVFAKLDLIEELKSRNKSMREIRGYLATLDEGP